MDPALQQICLGWRSSNGIILGCEGKRPLCHILGQVEQYTMGIERALVPTYVKIPTTDGTELKHWHLQTSHEVLASYIKAHSQSCFGRQ